MADLGLNRAANTIYTISPSLARRFLDEEYNPDKDYTENKFLANSWESVTARLYPLLTQEVLRMLAGASFTGRDLMRSEKPSTVYLRLPEADLLALSPITRLVLDSLIHELGSVSTLLNCIIDRCIIRITLSGLSLLPRKTTESNPVSYVVA